MRRWVCKECGRIMIIHNRPIICEECKTVLDDENSSYYLTDRFAEQESELIKTRSGVIKDMLRNEDIQEETTTRKKLKECAESHNKMLLEKNRRYGNSALEPLGIFTKHIKADGDMGLNSILVRLDDKLSRIKNASEVRKNDVSDLLGYLTLYCVGNGWTDFTDQID